VPRTSALDGHKKFDGHNPEKAMTAKAFVDNADVPVAQKTRFLWLKSHGLGTDFVPIVLQPFSHGHNYGHKVLRLPADNTGSLRH
jgi:hypothetical protein